MSNDFEKLSHYPSFNLTVGMLLLELLQEKKIGYNEVFSILGPKSSVNEIINGNRSLKNTQIKELAKLFGVNEEVFLIDEKNSLHSESSNLNPEFNNNSSYINDDNSMNNHFNGMDSTEESNIFENNQNHEEENQIKPFWED